MQDSFRSDDAIEQKFRELGNRAEGVIVAYLMGHDPDPKAFMANAASLIEGGADILEVGIPFSDPVADGPVIQAAGTRALSAGATPRKILDTIGQLSSQFAIPFVVLTYYNPILAMGMEQFMRNASDNGVNGIVVPDLPVEEGDKFRDIALKHNVDSIYLAAPNTSEKRLLRILEKSTGFVYLVSLYGVTGPRDTLSPQALETVKKVKSIAKGRIPVSAGFGISQPQQVSALLRAGADGAIIGSVLVRTVAEHLNDPGEAPYYLKKTIAALKQASKQRTG
ncbi:MAG TPA: tryptophan synthase subunit alpha [Candidatus Bathyarchaeia archaeon]